MINFSTSKGIHTSNRYLSFVPSPSQPPNQNSLQEPTHQATKYQDNQTPYPALTKSPVSRLPGDSMYTPTGLISRPDTSTGCH